MSPIGKEQSERAGESHIPNNAQGLEVTLSNNYLRQFNSRDEYSSR